MNNSLCRVCKQKEATIGEPPKWCSKACRKAEEEASKPVEVKEEIKVEPKPEPKPEIKPEPKPQPKQELPKEEIIKKSKLCIQCQKSEAKHHLSSGSYCDKCKPEEKIICAECGKEAEAYITRNGKTYCDKCWTTVKKILGKTVTNKREGVLNDINKINFVHISPNKAYLHFEEIEKAMASGKVNEDIDSETIDFFECMQFLKKAKKNELTTVQQWRISHYSSIPYGAFPDTYSSIAKLPEADIFLVTGGYFIQENGNFASDICYAIVFDRRIDPAEVEYKADQKKANLNIRNFRYITFKDEHLTQTRAAHCSIVVGDHLYVFGGRHDAYDDEGKFLGMKYVKSCEKLPINKVKKYMIKAMINPMETVFINEKWSPIGDIFEPRSNAMCFAYSKRIYIFGGYTGPKKLAKKVEVYDTVENKWSTLDIKYEFRAGSLVLLDGDDAYIVGGSDIAGPSDAVVKWNLKTNEITELSDLCSSRSEAKGIIALVDEEKYLYVFGGRASSMDYEFISLKDLNDKKKFELVEIKEVELEVKYDTHIVNDQMDPNKLIFSDRKFNPLNGGLFDEGYIGENVLILPD
jgi:hypothetical protein